MLVLATLDKVLTCKCVGVWKAMCKCVVVVKVMCQCVTPPTRHSKWMSSEGVTLRDCDCDSLTFSLSDQTPVPVFSSIRIISVITKIFLYIYTLYIPP